MNDLSHMTSVDLIVGLKLSPSRPSPIRRPSYLYYTTLYFWLCLSLDQQQSWLWIFVTMTGHRTHIVSSDDNKRVSLVGYDLWNIYFQICIRWTWELVGACLLASKQSRPELLVESVWHSGWVVKNSMKLVFNLQSFLNHLIHLNITSLELSYFNLNLRNEEM